MRYQSMHWGTKKNRISLIHLNKPLANGLVGMVYSSLFRDRIMIIVDDTPEDLREYDFACFACAENAAVPRVIMTRDVYYDIKRGKPYARTILLHEIGHYYHNDLSIRKGNRDAEREELVSLGMVSDEEARADSFAVDYLGAPTVILGLEELKSLVTNRYINYEEQAVNAIINEIDLRIKRISF